MKNCIILIVDDEPIILQTLKYQIERFLPAGSLIEIASSGEEAIELIDETSSSGGCIDAMITDFNLGDMKGTEVIQHLHSKFPSTPKALLTGQADWAEIENLSQNIQLQACFTKPWNSVDLESFIRRKAS